MGEDQWDPGANDIDESLATAFGLFALTDLSIHEAADRCDVTQWELERQIEQAGLAPVFGLDQDADVSETIDDILDQS